MFNFFCKIWQHPKINPGSAPARVDASSFALKSNLASLKTEADKLDIDKLTPVPND